VSLLRGAIECATGILCRLRRHRRIDIVAKSGNPVKVNLGCGLAVAPGWINIDGSLNAFIANLPRVFHRVAYRITGANRYYNEEEYCRLLGDHHFVHHDLSLSVPLHDESVDYVYTSHFLEHLFRVDAETLLWEIHRALKPGGIARIAVPDLEFAVRLYGLGEKERMLTQYFFVDDKESFFARHKYMYDLDLLSHALKRAGFSQVYKCAFKEGATPDIALLDNRPEESLFLEAIK
jgi:predicted SAM-dependent methyltransferase